MSHFHCSLIYQCYINVCTASVPKNVMVFIFGSLWTLVLELYNEMPRLKSNFLFLNSQSLSDNLSYHRFDVLIKHNHGKDQYGLRYYRYVFDGFMKIPFWIQNNS